MKYAPNDRLAPVSTNTAIFAILEELEQVDAHMYANDIAESVECKAKKESVSALVRYLWCYRELLERIEVHYVHGEPHPVGSQFLYRINEDGIEVLEKSREEGATSPDSGGSQ